MRPFSPRALPVPVALTITAPLGCGKLYGRGERSGSFSYSAQLAHGQ